jgi:UDP-N-acetylglucosamine transferase subunit ALG13
LNTLDAGKYPILIPRLSKHSEHIDDHQFEIASLVASFNLAQVITDKLTREDLLAAKRRHIKVLNKY